MIKFALLGCGRIAKRHSELLGLGKISGACLAAVCDVDPEKARKIGKEDYQERRNKVPHFTTLVDIICMCVASDRLSIISWSIFRNLR